MKFLTFGEIMLRLKAPGQECFFQSPMLEATFGGGEATAGGAARYASTCRLVFESQELADIQEDGSFVKDRFYWISFCLLGLRSWIHLPPKQSGCAIQSVRNRCRHDKPVRHNQSRMTHNVVFLLCYNSHKGIRK